MPRFFNRIRKQLAKENKFFQYSRYAIGEILLVVIGILIALQVDAWNEDRKIDGIRKNYYKQILIDLDNESKNIENRIERLESSIESFNRYVEFNKTPNLELDQIVAALGKVDHSIGYLSFNTNTMETLEATGDIRLIPTGIRNRLLELKRLQDEMILVATGNISAYLNAQQEGYGLGGVRAAIIQGYQHILNQRIIENTADLILKVEATYALKNFTEKERLEYLTKMLNKVKALKEKINRELDK